MKCALALASMVTRLLSMGAIASAQQVVDTTYRPLANARHARVTGPRSVVVIDQAHHNFHTAGGRYLPFARLLQDAGYVVRPGMARYDSTTLASVGVLVIANAVNAANEAGQNWRLPILPAFDASEIASISAWVKRGGSLWIIADHMPFAGAAADLGRAVGVIWLDGFALPDRQAPDPRTGDYPITFRRSNGSLGAIPPVEGSPERIDSVVTFTGSAFRFAPGVRVGVDAWPLFTFRSPTRVWLPRVAWAFGDSVAWVSGDGLLQGALLRVGLGRVAAFGEAAMFSAQRKGPGRTPMGMNAPEAAENARFTIAVLRWLASDR
jgi:hypothetical protein